jgi:hypothetical protein
MAGKKTAASKKPAHKKQVELADLPSPGQELSDGQAKAVKGGHLGAPTGAEQCIKLEKKQATGKYIGESEKNL